MPACPRCHAPELDRGFCARCGFHDPRLAAPPAPPAPSTPRVVAGTPDTPPPPPRVEPPPPADEGVDLPGFEPTAHAAPTPAPPPAAERAQDFRYTTCPRCQQPQPDPPETFCPHCSYRVVLRRRRAAASTERVKNCKDCGTANDPSRVSCVNCGFRLPDLD